MNEEQYTELKKDLKLEKLRAQIKDIKSRNKFWQLFWTYTFSGIVSAVGISGFYYAVLKPTLDQKQEYREYYYKNLATRLLLVADSLEAEKIKLHAMRDSLGVRISSFLADSARGQEEFITFIDATTLEFNNRLKIISTSLDTIHNRIKLIRLDPVLSDNMWKSAME